MLLPFLASLTALASARAAPVLAEGTPFERDTSLSEAGRGYKGLDSGWLEWKVDAGAFASYSMRMHFRRLPRDAGRLDRYELRFDRLESSGHLGKDNFTRELANRRLMAFDAGERGQELEDLPEKDRDPNKAALSSLKLDENARKRLMIHVNDGTLSAYVSFLSAKWSCLPGLEGKPIGARWKFQLTPEITQECEFVGWGKISQQKIALVSYTMDGEGNVENTPKGQKKTKMTFHRKGAYFFNPATQELLRDVKTTFTMDPPLPAKGGSAINSAHAYAE